MRDSRDSREARDSSDSRISRDSSLGFLGEIPAGWEIRPFGRAFTFQKGLNITKADLKPEGIKVISYGQIHAKENPGTGIIPALYRFVSPGYLEEAPQCLARENDFLFADTSEDLEGCGNCAFIDSNETIFAGYHTLICRPKNIEFPKYLAYFFLSEAWRGQLRGNCNGVKVFSISRSALRKTMLLLPPLSTQRAIVAYLDAKCAKIDAAIRGTEKEIEHLKEYRQRLIADVVTGKKMVN